MSNRKVTAPSSTHSARRVESLAKRINADPSLLRAKFDLPYGTNLTLRGVTLLHIAAEFNERECVDLLLNRGADLLVDAVLPANSRFVTE